ncbi:MAG: esterase [Flavobacterium sp. BFFFF2]|nr:MAG: esterase [Flavobacterium sp. BFFFF2]
MTLKMLIAARMNLVITLFFSLQFVGYSQEIAKVAQLQLPSKILEQNRPVLVYTPKQYEERDLVSFDVIYVFDAQNRELFDLVHALMNFESPEKQYIVIGIASPAYEETNYYRNSDFSPKPLHVPIEKYLSNKPNAENFWQYVQNEVMPMIDQKYRTTQVQYAIGHSLSASFVLDKSIHAPELFTGFICVSPNLAYDNDRLANDFVAADFKKSAAPKFLYISQSNEPKTWAKPWGLAFEKVKNHVNSHPDFGKCDIILKEFPNNSHWSGFVPAVQEALKLLTVFIDKNPYKLVSNTQEVTFTIRVPNKEDDAYITGNQNTLGNWDPAKIKLHKVSAFERQITLHVQFPLAFKITKGSWQSQATTNQQTDSLENIVINKKSDHAIKLTVLTWNQ